MDVRTLSLLLLLTFTINVQADTPPLCGGPNYFLSMVDLGGNANSPCTAYNKDLITESYFTYASMPNNQGWQKNYPNTYFRLGLPYNFEVNLVPSYYTVQKKTPRYGNSGTALGLKHVFAYGKTWIFTMEGQAQLPDGDSNYGKKRLGGLLNAMFNFNLTDQLSLNAIIGISNQSAPRYQNNKNFDSLNPDFVLSYAPNDRTNLYLEIYGQTKTAWNQGRGFNIDGGVLFLVRKNLVVNVGIGRRLNGYLYNIENYGAVGAAFNVPL